MTYIQAIRYLESLINYEKIPAYPYRESFKLERIKEFLGIIGNPQNGLRCIHIAGSKGKGSTCAFIVYILREAGFSTGLYTSPHLSSFRERIRVLSSESAVMGSQKEEFEGMIAEEEITRLAERLKPDIEKYNKVSKYGELSFFEAYTAMAFAYFKEKKVDFAVLETGLGGSLDATNAVNSLICVITPISYEHTQYLGNTLSQIAGEKSGIIKDKGQIVISARQEKEAQEVIRARCVQTGSKLYEVGRDIFCEGRPDSFNIITAFSEYPALTTRLLGKHQLMNAAVSVAVIDSLRMYGVYIGIDSIRNGLYNTFWPGRCEVIAKDPLMVLDGAQNVASIKAIKETVQDNFQYKRLILVLGISQDKDIKGVCSQLQELADVIILTCADNPRAAKPQDLAVYFKSKETHITHSVKEAVQMSRKIAAKEDLILVTGSLFVVGEFRNASI